MQTYYYLAASQRYILDEEPTAEVLKERTRYYKEQEKAIDFFLIYQPAFLEAPELAADCAPDSLVSADGGTAAAAAIRRHLF